MSLFTITVDDGDMPADTAKVAEINAYSVNAYAPVHVGVNGSYVTFGITTPLLGYDSWDVKISAPGAKQVEYNYKNMKENKKIEYSLEKKKAQLVLLDPPPPPPPPTDLRVIATYSEEGSPVSGVEWSTDEESGQTNSLGQVIVSSNLPAKLVILNHSIDSISMDESVTIDVVNDY